jgi:effector-binding domain-containing protein
MFPLDPADAPRMKLLLIATGTLLLFASCLGSSTAPVVANPPDRVVPVGSSPQSVRANWKERLAQPYVFLEHRGDYRSLGDTMRRLFVTAQEAGIEPEGDPFALYFDNPGSVPLEQLRSRACLPVLRTPEAGGPLSFEVLPQAMVAYGLVPGPYNEVPRAYPAIFGYLADHGWEKNGPLREIYLVNPAVTESHGQLLCEVQIPWRVSR